MFWTKRVSEFFREAGERQALRELELMDAKAKKYASKLRERVQAGAEGERPGHRSVRDAVLGGLEPLIEEIAELRVAAMMGDYSPLFLSGYTEGFKHGGVSSSQFNRATSFPDSRAILRRCPFCSGVANLWASGKWYYVSCDQCGAKVGSDVSADDALKRWHLRPSKDDPA